LGGVGFDVDSREEERAFEGGRAGGGVEGGGGGVVGDRWDMSGE